MFGSGRELYHPELFSPFRLAEAGFLFLLPEPAEGSSLRGVTGGQKSMVDLPESGKGWIDFKLFLFKELALKCQRISVTY